LTFKSLFKLTRTSEGTQNMDYISPKATKLAYLSDSYLFHSKGVVETIVRVGGDTPEHKWGRFACVLSSTIFHAQGGGQPSDVGTITLGKGGDEDMVFTVQMVKLQEGGLVWHYGDIAGSTTDSVHDGRGAYDGMGEEWVGHEVDLAVDGGLRLLHARLHSAGHLIDVAMSRLGLLDTLVATKGYHFKDAPYVEFKGSTDAVLAELPDKLNEIIGELVRADITTTVEQLSREDASAKCGCNTTSYPESVRVVTVGGLPCPCGGTHVKSTKDLQEVTVSKVKKKKDIYKVSYTISMSDM
jgi:Ser-tRNA(Ala) deacylase AlaX